MMAEKLQEMTTSAQAAEVPRQEPGQEQERERGSGEEIALRPLTAFAQPSVEELEVARELVRSAQARGTALTGPGGLLTGPGGLLKALTKTVIETALDEEMTDHLGYGRHDRAGDNSRNS